ncbi:MAG TPA: cytochrome C oxidase subunit IV family protein [Bryobacteraceae bacterium]|nr:cytochrome C oxidase subunit IV family protein [Bryobacteraceae bacterium]
MKDATHITHHVTPVRTYLIVFLTLLVLTVTTTKVAEIDLGEWNFVVAFLIAITKASLVVLFFMHVRYSTSLTKLFVCAGLFWMAILISITLCDYISRDWQYLPQWIH